MKRFTITTLGCKVNQYESEAMAWRLKRSEWVPAESREEAELCIVNTCAVTQKASMQSRQAVRQAVRSSPGARVIITGCYAQTEPDEIKKIEGVYRVIGCADKHKIPEMIMSEDRKDRPFSLSCRNICHEHNFNFEQAPAAVISGERTRPFLKIQDGCNAFCTYCIVPYARGRSRSMPPEEVLDSIKHLREAGYLEVVLLGIHLGCYGLDLRPHPTNLFALLNRIEASRAIDRVRLSSIEPCELTEDIVRLVAESDSFCSHFHIPLQSGDDSILKRMHRPYTASLFKDLVIKIHESVPDAAIGVDILTGFPGETEEAFENTYSLIEELPVTYLHVFPFSPRKKTPASRYPAKVSPKIIKARCQRMRELGDVKKREFYKKIIGKRIEVLVEGKREVSTGCLKGITSNYIPVLLSGGDELKNSIVKVMAERLNGNSSVFGAICDAAQRT